MSSLISGLSWELSVLSRAIGYQNLSGAAVHVGLSQPQLSRIIAKLESSLGVILLDRGARRKSAWTPLARKLAETYLRASRNLDAQIEGLVDSAHPKHLYVGALEGLSGIASAFVQHVFTHAGIPVVELNIYDLNQLEELFLRGDLNLIFTFREPGRRKFRYSRTLGTQSLEHVERPGKYQVMSTFEYGAAEHGVRSTRNTRAHKPQAINPHVLVSNSLAVRKSWIERYGGAGIIPSDLRTRKTLSGSFESEILVLLLGSDLLPEKLWNQIETWRA